MLTNISLLVGMYGGGGSIEELAQLYISRNEEKLYMCSICGKVSRDLHNAKTHLEHSHFPSETGYECQFCGAVLKTKNSLACHISKKHRNK